jgi:hypothetical protein
MDGATEGPEASLELEMGQQLEPRSVLYLNIVTGGVDGSLVVVHDIDQYSDHNPPTSAFLNMWTADPWGFATV